MTRIQIEGKFVNPAEVVGIDDYEKLISVDNKWNGGGNRYQRTTRVYLTGGHTLEFSSVTPTEVDDLLSTSTSNVEIKTKP